jgi:hypothetical protein
MIHPRKIYNALKVAAFVLAIGPQPSLLTEILTGLGGPNLRGRSRRMAMWPE